MSDAERAFFFFRVPRKVETDGEAVRIAERSFQLISEYGSVMQGWYVLHKRSEDCGFPLLSANQAMRAEIVMVLYEHGRWSEEDILLL